MSNFVILIGGPGLFKGCDKAHDQTWTNYIVPLQLAAIKNLYKKQKGEKVHWVLYEPPYKKRWADDSIVTENEQKTDDGFHLHSIRKKAADKILAKGFSSYIARIKGIAKKHKITYKGINKPDQFWKYLESLPDGSISRVWYSGHASDDGLMLTINHFGACEAGANPADMIDTDDIPKKAALIKKFEKKTVAVSKFYGCYTQSFAKNWNKTFHVTAAGAERKIDFGVIDRPSNIVNVMERIEKTPTSEGPTGWAIFK